MTGSFDYAGKAAQIRRDVLRASLRNGLGHIASSLSCLDLLVVLHYGILQEDDVCILSKGHGWYALAAILADKGLIERWRFEEWHLPGCVEISPSCFSSATPLLLGNTGSLGHGLSLGCGIAMGKRLRRDPGRIYVICGDGELDEGSTLEAISFLIEAEITDLTLIVDYNRLRALGPVGPGMALAMEWAERWLVHDACNGHDYDEILTSLEGVPQVLVAHTVKGKGVPFMEGKAAWHYRQLETDEERSWTVSYLGSDPTPPGASSSSIAGLPGSTPSETPPQTG
jgi:transketolase